MDNKYKTFLTKIPSILTSDDDLIKNFEKITSELQNIVEFDNIYICYINAGCANIQYRKSLTEVKPVDDETSTINFPEILKTKLYDSTITEFDENSSFFKALALQKTNSNYVLIKLGIRETIFGFILLSRQTTTPFKSEEFDILNAFSALVSYSIKDSELSSVFKLQLRALQDNILEKTKAYATIKKQNEKIVAADKLKNEFLANISHELRTPLNAIIGFSEALAMKIFGPLTEKQEEYVTDINASGIHLLGMINEILELSKIEAKAVKLALSRFNIQTSLNEVVNIVKPLANKKNINLIKDSKDFCEIDADYQKIQQILYNLLSNAIKFTQTDGSIHIGYTVDKKHLTLYVKDNGVGIDMKYKGKIFGKFVQLNNVYSKKESSTGLGLTITKELTELHKGKIWFESVVGEGTTFYVKLPLRHKKVKELF